MERKFKINSKYAPAGDQPKAIQQLVEGLNEGYDSQTLLGITGSGKTFTIANVIEKIQKPNNKKKKSHQSWYRGNISEHNKGHL